MLENCYQLEQVLFKRQKKKIEFLKTVEKHFSSTHPTIETPVLGQLNATKQALVQPSHEVAVTLLTDVLWQVPLWREQLQLTGDEPDDDDDNTVFAAVTLKPTARPIARQIPRMPNTVVRILQINVLLLHF
jgi:hypothetical protein